MNWKEVARDWLTLMRIGGFILLGVPTLGYTWFVWAMAHTSSPCQKDYLDAWGIWRTVQTCLILILLGVPTLGYTWVIFHRHINKVL